MNLKNTVEGLEYEADYQPPDLKARTGLWSKYAKPKVQLNARTGAKPDIVEMDIDVWKMLYEIMVTSIKSVLVTGTDPDTGKVYDKALIEIKTEDDFNKVPIAIIEDLNGVVMEKFFRKKA